MFNYKVVLITVTLSLFATCLGVSTHCFVCTSRGELGDCKDPFAHNATSIRDLPGNPVDVVICPSGWCRKKIELVKGEAGDYGVSVERHCLLIAPPDGNERCAEVLLENKPTQLCFCKGDLCNSGGRLESFSRLQLIVFTFTTSILICIANAFL